MNTKKYLLIALLSVFALSFNSCEEEDPEESCAKGANMQEDWKCEVPVYPTFCSDGVNNSYYQYDGKKYVCDGVDASSCTKALDEIAEDLKSKGDCGKAKIYIEEDLDVMATKLLEEVKINSLCK